MGVNAGKRARRFARALCIGVVLFACVLSAQEKKPLANADILEMVRSGIEETAIVLAIRQGPTDLDTSQAALDELKKKGVTADILSAMVQRGTPTGESVTVSEGENPAEAKSAPPLNSSNCWGDPATLVEGEKLNEIACERFHVERHDFSGAYYTLSSPRSRCRITSRRPRFSFYMKGESQPNSAVTLVCLATRGDSRAIRIAVTTPVFSTLGYPKGRIVELEIAEVSSESGGHPGRRHFVATPRNDLSPGEYAFAFGPFAYDFGVDPGP